MTEITKTLAMVAAAVVALLAAFLDLSGDSKSDLQEQVGTRLNQFEETPPKRLMIIKFDKENVVKQKFEVAEKGGLWLIPSKQGYPADAAQRMAEAATCMANLEILRIAAQSPSEHAALGVISPSTSGLGSKSEGVGTRVILSDETGETLTDMIIGKQVKEADSQYYLRNTNQDAVFVVAMNPDKLSTRFEDWIEDDLLQLNPMDIRRLHIKDYAAKMFAPNGILQIAWDRRGEMTLLYDDTESSWSADLLQAFDPKKGDQGELVAYTLAEDEELNDEALNGLRTALDELSIVDVERKPEGLSADLKAGADFLKNQETATILALKGFAPVKIGVEGEMDILSSEGEIVCTMRDGVEYVLRFGNMQLGTNEPTESQDPSEDSTEEAGIHRYLFVMARFNTSMIEQPKLAELPELPEEGEDASEKDESNELDTPGESASADGREAIEKSNQRLQDEYQQQIAAGQQRVQDLNERFGDWYYVIDNQVYNQIHLGRDQVIVKKKSPEEEKKTTPNGIPGLPNLPIGS